MTKEEYQCRLEQLNRIIALQMQQIRELGFGRIPFYTDLTEGKEDGEKVFNWYEVEDNKRGLTDMDGILRGAILGTEAALLLKNKMNQNNQPQMADEWKHKPKAGEPCNVKIGDSNDPESLQSYQQNGLRSGIDPYSGGIHTTGYVGLALTHTEALRLTAGYSKSLAEHLENAEKLMGWVGKSIATLILVLLSVICHAQHPKKHVYYDTVKTVKERIDFVPDTIPVYFLETKVSVFNVGTFKVQGKKDSVLHTGDTILYQRTIKGYLVWQTFKKVSNLTGSLTSFNTFNNPILSDYYRDDYNFSMSIPGKFLYEDRKTVGTGAVTYCVKR